MRDTIADPQEVEIRKLEIIPSDGEPVDIENICATIDIYEDIYQPAISGAISLVDSQDLLSTLPIIGNEKIKIEIVTPSLGPEGTMKVEGRVVKVDGRAPSKEYTMAYVLHFTSPETIYSAGLKFSKSYKNELLSDVAESIYNSFLEPIRNKQIQAEPTENNRSIIIPNWSPFAALKWLAKNCKSAKYAGSAYLFFERRDSFVFTSLEALYNVPTTAKYFYGLKHQTDSQGLKKRDTSDWYNVDYWQVKDSASTIDNISRGTFAGRLISNDLVKRKIETKNYDYLEDFGKFSHLGKSSIVGSGPQGATAAFPIMNNDFYSDLSTSNLTLVPKHFNAFGEEDNGNYLEDIILQGQSQFGQLNNIKIEMYVAGNTNRSIGEVIEFDFPSYKPSKDDAAEKEKYLSGRYLVTAIRHNIEMKTGKHRAMMECSKDAYSDPLPVGAWIGA